MDVRYAELENIIRQLDEREMWGNWADELTNEMRKWMKGCVSNVLFSIIINGRTKGKFREERGLRQEDPLSPFLFNIVVDGLSRLVDKAKAFDEVRGFEVGKEKIEVTYSIRG